MDKITVADLYSSIPTPIQPMFSEIVYPWEVLPRIAPFLAAFKKNVPDGYREIAPDVWVGPGVTVSPTAVLVGPAVIGEDTEIRPGAYLRGNIWVGKNCVIGNSTELKNCVLFDRVQVPHFNYVGDSVLGTHTHLGGGTICSNLKSDGRSVVVHGEKDYETGLRKVGSFLGDGADVGCGCVLNPGTVVGRDTCVYPLVALRGVYPASSIVKTATETVAKEPR